MEEKKGISSIGLLVTILVILFALTLLVPMSIRVRQPSRGIFCGTNLKGLGTACIVYANDSDDWYPKLGKGSWSKELGYSYEDSEFKPYEYVGPCTITSSLYLLVREADVSPRSFVCPQSEETPFDGPNTKGLNIVELWDFGANPYEHVSYAYHQPYSRYRADSNRSASFAIMADMNPWMENGDFIPQGQKIEPPQIIQLNDPKTWKLGNATSHRINEMFKKVEGQYVLYADGHTSFEKTPNVGVKNDNIYTYWSTYENPTEQDKQGGTAPTGRSPENDAKSVTDSFLAI